MAWSRDCGTLIDKLIIFNSSTGFFGGAIFHLLTHNNMIALNPRNSKHFINIYQNVSFFVRQINNHQTLDCSRRDGLVLNSYSIGNLKYLNLVVALKSLICASNATILSNNLARHSNTSHNIHHS